MNSSLSNYLQAVFNHPIAMKYYDEYFSSSLFSDIAHWQPKNVYAKYTLSQIAEGYQTFYAPSPNSTAQPLPELFQTFFANTSTFAQYALSIVFPEIPIAELESNNTFTLQEIAVTLANIYSTNCKIIAEVKSVRNKNVFPILWEKQMEFPRHPTLFHYLYSNSQSNSDYLGLTFYDISDPIYEALHDKFITIFQHIIGHISKFFNDINMTREVNANGIISAEEPFPATLFINLEETVYYIQNNLPILDSTMQQELNNFLETIPTSLNLDADTIDGRFIKRELSFLFTSLTHLTQEFSNNLTTIFALFMQNSRPSNEHNAQQQPVMKCPIEYLFFRELIFSFTYTFRKDCEEKLAYYKRESYSSAFREQHGVVLQRFYMYHFVQAYNITIAENSILDNKLVNDPDLLLFHNNIIHEIYSLHLQKKGKQKKWQKTETNFTNSAIDFLDYYYKKAFFSLGDIEIPTSLQSGLHGCTIKKISEWLPYFSKLEKISEQPPNNPFTVDVAPEIIYYMPYILFSYIISASATENKSNHSFKSKFQKFKNTSIKDTYEEFKTYLKNVFCFIADKKQKKITLADFEFYLFIFIKCIEVCRQESAISESIDYITSVDLFIYGIFRKKKLPINTPSSQWEIANESISQNAVSLQYALNKLFYIPEIIDKYVYYDPATQTLSY